MGLSIVIIPFLVLAAGILYGFPADTARLFAWDIRPPMSAMMLGSAYAGGVWFFARVVQARTWREVQVGFPAVCTFASLLGVATVLHWDRFIHDSLAFVLWVGLYFTTPFLVLAVWLREQRARRGAAHAGRDGRPLSTAARWFFLAIAIATLPVAVALFVAPSLVGAAWPWALTPLTARVTSALFALPGVVALGIAIDGGWLSAGPALEAEVLSIALILLGVARDGGNIATDSPAAWLFVVGLAVLVLAFAALYAMSRSAARTAGLAEEPAATAA